MAAATVPIAMNLGDTKTLHPFFSKPQNKDCLSNSNPDHDTPPVAQPQKESDDEYEDTPKQFKKAKKASENPKHRQRKSTGADTKPVHNQSLLDAFTKRDAFKDAEVSETADGKNAENAVLLDSPADALELGQERRKRRRVSDEGQNDSAVAPANSMNDESAKSIPRPVSGSLSSWREQLESAAASADAQDISAQASVPDHTLALALKTSTEEAPATPPSQALPEATSSQKRRKKANGPSSNAPASNLTSKTTQSTIEAPRTPPNKMLKLNAGGKLGSPSVTSVKQSPRVSKLGGKGGSRKDGKPIRSQTVVLKYGVRDTVRRTELGQKIDQILNSGKKASADMAAPRSHPVKVKEPPKSTHPFFLGKREKKEMQDSKTAPVKTIDVTHSPRKSAVTPGKLRTDARQSFSDVNQAAFGSTLNRAGLIKHAGAREAPWPWKGITHLRDQKEAFEQESHLTSIESLNRRRAKGAVTAVSKHENIIELFTQTIGGMRDRPAILAADFPSPSTHSRLPQKIDTTGHGIRKAVQFQLDPDLISMLQSSSETSTPSPNSDSNKAPHPAIVALWTGLAEVLTPWDQGTCETQAWTSKYAPKNSKQVLQGTREINVLRGWLKALAVQGVEGASRDSARKAVKKGKPPKKKRKKVDELNGFIVDSDDDDNGMDELTEPEDLPEDSFNRHGGRRSTIRTGDFERKAEARTLKNIVLISGPNGCGKTAAVHAIAKELNFEIFEINSGSRRSGKDITEKVGNMTENHLVNNHHEDRQANKTEMQAVAAALHDSDTERAAEAFQKDVASGRQGMMTSFFKTNPKATPKKGTKTKVKKIIKPAAVMKQINPKSGPRQSQKQSLILFEEVDVLYEEDKNFWSTIIDLANQSKRPIILTCTDESLVPFEDLSFEAVLRFVPPAEATVSIFLLLMAAREGHVLHRDALTALYRSKGHDLRASITELDFWCQMAVGDRKGGLEWFYQRWPKGTDVDEDGRTKRIASGGTYQTGMGWIGHDHVERSGMSGGNSDEELQRDLWREWGLDPLSSCQRISEEEPPSVDDVSTGDLTLLELSLEGRSAADVFCRIGLPHTSPAIADTTQPPLPERSRLSYTSEPPLLQTDESFDYENIDMQIATSIALTSDRICRRPSVLENSCPPLGSLSKSLEDTYTAAILARKHRSSHSSPQLDHNWLISTLEPLSVPIKNQLFSGPQPMSSIISRPISILTTDIAPYVRSICASDQRLEAQRLILSNLISEGGRSKRARTTRASRSALEGGRRETTRKERWFCKELNYVDVLRTAGESWAAMGTEHADIGSRGDGSERASLAGSAEDVGSPRT